MKRQRKRTGKKIITKIGSIAVAASLLAGGLQMAGMAGEKAKKSKAAVLEIVVDGNDVKAENVNGLTYKGFGLLSANATSDLLLDYKAEQPEAYAKLMQYLFGGEHPIMNHVKLEMGNDRNNSTGPQPATKRSESEKVNVLRDPSWQIAADAKKINPKVKVSVLKWCAPAWANSSEQLYKWYKESILAAYEKYGYIVDYVNPNSNERWDSNWDPRNTKLFAKWIAEEDAKSIPDEKALALYKKIKLIVSDEAGTVNDGVGEVLKSDEEFYKAVDVVGYHYSPLDDSKGSMKWLADEKDKEVWNSEAQATFSDSFYRPYNNEKLPKVAGAGIGGTNSALEMGNTIIKGLVESRRSHVIYQPAVGSFYEGGQFSHKELVSARDPWSGWMHYDTGLLVLDHISKFARTGWENEENTEGIWRVIPSACESTARGTNPVEGRNGGANYMTLASPSKDAFSTVIVNDSEKTLDYQMEVKNMKLPENTKLAVWETRALDDGAFNENYMKCLGTLEKSGSGTYSLTVKPNSIVTMTTIDTAETEKHIQELPVDSRRIPLDTDETGNTRNVASEYLYADDFSYTGKTVPVLDGKGGFTGETEDYIAVRGGDTGAIPRYTNNINGAFEVYKTEDGNYVMRQQLDKSAYGIGYAWNDGDPVVLIGDRVWTNYSASVKVLFEHTKNSPYGMVAIRQTGSSHHLADSSGYSLKVFSTGEWQLYRRNTEVKSGEMKEEDGFKKGEKVWNELKLEGAGSTIRAYVNDKLLATYTDEKPITAGRIGLGSAYTFTRFDDLKVKKLEGYVPYYKEYLDNLQHYDLTKERNCKLIYNNLWNHKNGQSMYCYQRSVSTNKRAGATLTYNFKGTGLELLGETKSSATLKAVVDGQEYETKPAVPSDYMNAFYSLQGLEYGVHSVTIEVTKGIINLDAVGVLGKTFAAGDAEEDTEEVIVERPKEPVETAEPTGTPTVAPTAAPTAAPGKDTEKKNVLESGNGKYQLVNANKKQVSYTGCVKKAKSIAVPDTVKLTIDGVKASYKVVRIADNALKGNKEVAKLTIGKNIVQIGKKAFSGCKNLKQIVIKTSKLTKKNVGANAFSGVYKKVKIKVPKKQKKSYTKLLRAKGVSKSAKIKK